MAHTKAKGTSKNGRDSNAKRLGVKIFGGAKVEPGQIIIRQRGTKWHPGFGVARGGDDTLFATLGGMVEFLSMRPLAFTGNRSNRRVVRVAPVQVPTDQISSQPAHNREA